jgi:CHAT domain-containing protein
MGDSATRVKDFSAAREHFERALNEVTAPGVSGEVLHSEMMVFVLRLVGIPVEMFDGGEQGFGSFIQQIQPLLLDVFKLIARLGLVDSHLALSDCAGAAKVLGQARESNEGLGSSKVGWIAANILEKQMKSAWTRYEKTCGAAPALPPSRPLNGPAEEIQELRRKIEEAHGTGDLATEADLFTRLASVHQFWGDFEDSLAALERSLEIAHQLPDLRRQARAHDALGLHLLLMNRYEGALIQMQRALEIYRQIGSEFDVASLLTFIGSMNSVLGFQQTAIDQLEESRQLARKNGAVALESEALYALAETYFLKDTPDAQTLPDARDTQEIQDAKEAREKALSYLRQYFNNSGSPLHQVKAQTALATFLVRLGRDQEAEHHASEALARAEQLGIAELEASAHTSLAMLAHRRGLSDQAYAHLDRAREIHRANGSRFQEAASTALKGIWLFQQGNTAEGISLYREAIDLYEKIQGEVHVPDLLSGLNDLSGYQLYEVFIELLVAQGKAETAFEYSEHARARAFLNSLGNRKIGRAGSGAQELVAKAEELRGKLRDLETSLQRAGIQPGSRSTDPRQSKLENMRREYSQILLQLKLSDPEYAALVEIETLGLERLQRDVIAPGTVLVEFFVTTKRTLAWVIDRGTFRMVEIKRGGGELRQQIKELRQLLDSHAGRGRQGRGVTRLSPSAEALLRKKTSDLYSVLIEPLKLPDGHQNLIIIPHDVLHYLPFAALWNAKREHYLIEDYTLSYAPSASILPHLKAKTTPTEGRALVAGDPALGLLAKTLLPLAAARSEAVAIAKILGTTPALGDAASETLIYEQAGKINLLHLAAHGFYDEKDPSYSRIELAADSRNDGHLEVHELMSRVDLHGVDLVVLSACDSGLGSRSKGDEIVGLTRAFLYAGSPAVVATLWAIDDAASETLMKIFYQRLRQGDTAAEALRAAQLEVNRNPRWRSPYFWAAFSLIGDSRVAPWRPAKSAGQALLPRNDTEERGRLGAEAISLAPSVFRPTEMPTVACVAGAVKVKKTRQ